MTIIVSFTSQRELPFQFDFGLEAGAVARDRGHGEPVAVAKERHGCVSGVERTINAYRVPALGVTDIPDGHVIVLTPEKRHRVKTLASPQHIARRDLPLALGDDPVLHADTLTRMRIGPSGDIPGRENAWRAALEELVDDNAAIDRQSGLLRKCG